MYGSDGNGKVFEEEGSQETQPHEETEEYLTDAKDAHIQPEPICPNDFILADISIASSHSSNDDAQGPFIEEEIPSGDPHVAEMIVPHPAINELLPVHEPGDEVIVQHPADNDIPQPPLTSEEISQPQEEEAQWEEYAYIQPAMQVASHYI